MNPETFKKSLEQESYPIDAVKMEQYNRYLLLLQEWNNKINLTAITEEDDVYLKHFYDSLTLARFVDFNQPTLKLCDVGSGAGFPSIPLKILFPEIEITIVDSLKKRIRFLEILVEELALENVHLIHARAEDFGQKDEFRSAFDVVTARAVARLSVLAEFCLPITKEKGVFAAMKGSQGEEELEDSKKALKTLGGRLRTIETFELPEDAGERSILLIDKVKKTPKKYPRQAGTPNKKPL
ncbi:16S rRNA (guanine527-N7)-methyltransferase [Atopostipes suicloacalis DSM 15692]|uniref:Ribosomal RNA small subunit methyltransferase G n=1 Tax=Atopostipes suicloacalis DSM 15692 TaxID=1121025 RepID=A0A1M4UGZ9_9LACT|nr:16S rRNA (guanine(527)-N(7))-methyltransferase RsmG [Atopostipes suicloacalis]SHE56006.1 16S rRNA (guanine527-N7)-methyltransferase [Atopostipes suicloacalis DSM 15692]